MNNGDFRVTLVAIDSDPGSLALIAAALESERDLEIVAATDTASGLETVFQRRAGIVLLDLTMPGMSGMEALERIIGRLPETDVIPIAAHYSPESAVAAIQKGASDYWTKPLSPPRLRQQVSGLIERRCRRGLAARLDEEVLRANQLEGMVGRSPAMLDVFLNIRRVAPHFRTALIAGPAGSGKELAAAALHRLSPGRSARFAVCRCAAVDEALIDSELFGHAKGAFLGAARDKPGLFEYADGGVAFLDDIGDMPLEAQSKLLRVLETGEVQRVGSPARRTVDVRVVAAASRDLRDLIDQRRFRADLYYRLSMVQVRLPPLADRREDIPLLERHFLGQFNAQLGKTVRGLTPHAQAVLARYHWPGNVRELKTALGSACMTTQGERIDVQDLPERLRHKPERDVQDDDMLTLDEVERRHILRVLARVSGNKARAAKILGINRSTIYRILEEGEMVAAAGAG